MRRESEPKTHYTHWFERYTFNKLVTERVNLDVGLFIMWLLATSPEMTLVKVDIEAEPGDRYEPVAWHVKMTAEEFKEKIPTFKALCDRFGKDSTAGHYHVNLLYKEQAIQVTGWADEEDVCITYLMEDRKTPIDFLDLMTRVEESSTLITGARIEEFRYVYVDKDDYPTDISTVMKTKVFELESKHVIEINDDTKIFEELGEKVGWTNTVLGSHRNSPIKAEGEMIFSMADTVPFRPVKVVITRDGRFWADNTHHAVAGLIRAEYAGYVEDIPVYIVDFRTDVPTIYDIEGSVRDSVHDIRHAIASAKKIQDRVDLGWRPCEYSYTIGDLGRGLIGHGVYI